MFGLAKEQWEFILQELVTPLKQQGCRVYVFGSRARGDHSQFSDIDMLVGGGSEQQDMISEISEVLLESELPIKVDIVLEEDLAESYQESVFRDRVLV